MAHIGSIIDNKYEILKEIGKGGMSTVYLAMDKRLNKQWAVKEIKKIANDKNNEIVVQSLLVEANMMKKLDHPSLPRIVDIIDTGRVIYVIMDYIEGESLDKILKMSGAQAQDKVIEWAKQLCDVLNYLHSQDPPIIYRDMKPSNVMLKPEGTLKVIDFGIAREYKEHNIEDTVSLGTKGYAAPEQFGGKGQTDARTDIYCLGVTLYHLVTGQNPTEPPYEIYPIRRWNPYLSSGLEAVITKCTQLNPADRYENCDELMYALQHYNELDESYRIKQKKKLRGFVASVSMFIVMLVTGIGFNIASSMENDKDYESKVDISTSTDYKEKLNNYTEAIELYKYRYEAYIKLLEAYNDNNQFGDKESGQFIGYYNDAFNEKNKEKYDTTANDYLKMNYLAGTTYLYLYLLDDENTTMKVRAQKAYPFFEAVVNSKNKSYENYSLAESYYFICGFYKDFVASPTNTKEPTYEVYDRLVSSLRQCITNLDQYDDLQYIKLTVYEAIEELLYGQRKGLAATGIEYSRVLELLEIVQNSTGKLVVNQERSLKKQEKILNSIGQCIEEIYITFENMEVK